MWVDSHNHHYLSSLSVLKRLSADGLEAVVEASWIPVRPSSWATLEDLYRWLLEVEPQRLSKANLKLIAALGVHPRCIPKGIDYRSLEGWLQDDRVKALGEVGIETGSEEEVEAFSEQLRIAKRLDRPAIVHTPRNNKLEAARLELKLIRESGFPEEMAVIDHFNFELLKGLDKGSYFYGLSLQPGKLKVEEALSIISYLDPSRILINSDSSTEESEPSWGLELLKALSEKDRELALKIGRENAYRFYKS